MTRKILVPVLPTLLIVVGVWFSFDSCDRKQGADRIPSAMWATTPAGERLILHEQLDRSSDDGSWTVDRMVSIDPLTGSVSEPWFAKFDGEERVSLASVRGSSLWFRQGTDFFLVPSTGGPPLPLSALSAQYPVVPAPWYSATVDGEGLVRVEADDRTHWRIDVSSKLAERDDSVPVGWSPALQWSGLGFVDVPAQRHSDPVHFALAPVDEYGGVAGAPLESRFEAPRFLGARVIEVNGCALVGERATVTCIDRSSTRGWSWTVPEGAVQYWAAWPVDGGALVRTDRRFTVLSAAGQVRWTLVR